MPVPNGSLSDISFVVKKSISAFALNEIIAEKAKLSQGIIEYSTEPLVSADIIGNTHSSILDAALTHSQGRLLKLVTWYDNETGYACRLLDLAQKM